jgi:hypothetical protein
MWIMIHDAHTERLARIWQRMDRRIRLLNGKPGTVVAEVIKTHPHGPYGGRREVSTNWTPLGSGHMQAFESINPFSPLTLINPE